MKTSTMGILGAAVLLIVGGASVAHAQPRIDIGIHLPGPPSFVVVPGTPVYYAPRAPANVFFYGGQYWVYNGGWYAGPSWNGPWGVVGPAVVPAPILRVPVRYYPVPPSPWRGWRRDAPPHWGPPHGREWREAPHERAWREREEHWKHGEHWKRAAGPERGGGHGHHDKH